MPLEAGRRLGLFEVISPLGAGGMGEVYRARDARLGRDVALKVLPDAFSSRPDRRARFEREARVLASFKHPGIAAIHGFEESDGVSFLVLELVEGKTLSQRLDRLALPVRDSLEVAQQIAAALEAAHEKGIIHRDLKPSNVMQMPDGRIKLLDFGLAKALVEDSGPVTSQAPTASDPPTSDGSVLGTAPYMSPEQARGEAVDKRTDVWAFGCVLYEMLSGRRVFKGATTSDVIASLLTAEPDWEALPAGVPPSIRTLLRRCLTRDLSRRIHDIGDARIEIVEALEERPLPAPGLTGGSSRSRRWALAGSLCVLFLASGLAYRWLTRTENGRVSVGSRFVIPTSGGARFSEDSYVPFAVSPDGRRLVYVTDDGLFLRSLDEAEARPLPGGEEAYDPFFSPDGGWVAFGADTSLKKIPIGGGAAPVVLCEAEDLLGGVWSPEGTIIFASSDRGPLLRVSASGGQPQPATRLLAGELGHLWPELLPGGQVLLFTVRTGPGTEDFRVVAQSLESGERRLLVEGGARARYAASGHLVYARGETLFAARFDLARLRLEGPAVPVLEGVATGPTANAQFAFSPAGNLFYISAAGPARRSLVLVDRRGVASPLPLDPRPYVFPRISPDGRRLAVQVGDWPRSNVWIYEMKTGSFNRLTSGERDTWPCWTPDGKRLAFASGTGVRLRVTWQAADGSEPPERLTDAEANLAQLSWSPDGRTLLFTEIGQSFQGIRALRLGMPGDPEILVSGSAGAGRVSPDGRWLTYRSNESGQPELHIRPFDRPGPGRQLTTEGGNNPTWSRDGRELFYGSRGNIMALPMDMVHGLGTGPPRALFEDRDAKARGFLDFDTLPDGRFVMVRAETAPGAIQVVTGWFDQLQRVVPK